MAQLSETRTFIADKLERSDMGTQIDREINRAIEHYEEETFWFQDNDSAFSTVTAQEVYTSADSIPTNIKDLYRVEISSSSISRYQLNRRDLNWIRNASPGGTTFTGRPTDFAIWDEEFYLYPVPDQTYSIRVFYEQKFDTLSADADTNAWLTNAEDLVESHVVYVIANDYLDDDEKAARAARSEMRALKSLRKKTAKLIATGHIKRKPF